MNKLSLVLIFSCLNLPTIGLSRTYHMAAKSTLSALEMDTGDTLNFKLLDGEIRQLILLNTSAKILETNLDKIGVPQKDGGTLYQFSCEISIDGQIMPMVRYVCSQESFYEPYVINGMRIWFDGVQDIFTFLNENHGNCKPNKNARFAFQDATMRICPDTLFNWYPNQENILNVAKSYNGDDVWMGSYQGADAHGGLDINMKKGTKVYAPMDFDDHYLFNSLYNGDKNNRWRGFRQWPNGDVWVLQNHHLLDVLIPEHQPIKAGSYMGLGAGVFVGNNAHNHYYFRIIDAESKTEISLDPWILFWQIFEDNKRDQFRGEICPLSPSKVGESIHFNSTLYNTNSKDSLLYFWTFGDGGWSNQKDPKYVYTKEGIYPITLTIDNGNEVYTYTQHITINGNTIDPAKFILKSDEPSFYDKMVFHMDVYGQSTNQIPHTIHFIQRKEDIEDVQKSIRINGYGQLNLDSFDIDIEYLDGMNWLHMINAQSFRKDKVIELTTRIDHLEKGRYRALVTLTNSSSINPVQGFLVQLSIPNRPAVHQYLGNLNQVIIDNEDLGGFHCTPYFWVGHRFKFWKHKGYQNFYLSNGQRNNEEAYGRFTPDLLGGKYRVSLHPETPFDPQTSFYVKVQCAQDSTMILMRPSQSRHIGDFQFNSGNFGYVEIQNKNSTGKVILDAVVFEPIRE